ncbi:MAG TPA: transferrin receptor-like dimerization domain-containing protein [Thermoanaerobaculia bacterium]|nr:transferrin receptor-like dimerization domain-containing protein [Thermoanaerobaculia bacterium]
MPGRSRNAASVLALVCTLAATAAPAAPPASQEPMLGFSNERATAQRALEARFDSHLKVDNLREWMKRLAARPHHVGSPYGRENAEFMVELFRSWGYDARLEEFHVLLPTPRVRLVEMLEPTPFKASLTEPTLPEDATSGQVAEQLPTYNAYSIDGDVTGELVYVNYGVPRDYEELERRGIDVKGKIVLARYGGSWRGIKPKVAAEHGAVGCLIYSDPEDDGYFYGDIYPKGGYRPEHGVQRGSVADMPTYPGDPLTPFVGATKDAKRLKREEAATLTKIPVLPISYADALPLLRALGGPIAPENWRGVLPTPYRLGPGPAKVRLKLEFDWKIVPAYDVIAVLRGSEQPDQWIVRGNHHDAWVNGATDPVSGMVAVMEEARAVSELVKTGWRPKRTIVYAGWDAEEQGLLGSVEWAETHADLLRRNAVAYINSDSNGRGFLYVGGSHTLEVLANQAAREVTEPQKKDLSVAERLLAVLRLYGSPEDQQAAKTTKSFLLEPLGSGSDYTPFLQHLGIASLNIGYGGEGQYGQYHSIYDSFDHYVRFMDPDFGYGIALAKTAGRIVLRLADADVLPFELTRPAATIGGYVDEVVKLADDMRKETEERNARLDAKVYEAAADPTETWVAPRRLDPVPYLNFAPLQNAVATLKQSAAAWEKAQGAASTLSAADRTRLDGILMGLERALTRREGLPRRPWYTHHIYAPGFYTGYGVKTLPGVREAIEERQWKEAEEQIGIAARVIEGFAKEIDRATAVLAGAGR